MHNLSCFPILSQSKTSNRSISEFNELTGIWKYSSHIGFKFLSILLLLIAVFVFTIVKRQYGSLSPLESAEGRFVALIKWILICHLSLWIKFFFSSIISPENGLSSLSITFITTLINPVFLPLCWTSIHLLYTFPISN